MSLVSASGRCVAASEERVSDRNDYDNLHHVRIDDETESCCRQLLGCVLRKLESTRQQ